MAQGNSSKYIEQKARIQVLGLEKDPLVTIVYANFARVSNEYRKIVPISKLNLQECFLQKFNPFINHTPTIDFKQFWLKVNMFSGLNVQWDVEITQGAYTYWQSLNHDDINLVMAISELTIGRFQILGSTRNRGIHIKPKNYQDVNIKSWIILEDIGNLKQKILLTTNNDNELEDFVSQCEKFNRKIIQFTNIDIHQILQKVDEVYILRQIVREVDVEDELINKSERIEMIQEFDFRDQDFINKKTEVNFEANQYQNLAENIKRHKSRRKQVQISENVQKILNSAEINNLQNTCQLFQNTMDQVFLRTHKLKKWISLLLYWHATYEKLKNEHFYNFFPYQSLNMLWKIKIEYDFIKYLKTIPDDLRKVYLYKIIRLSQGFALDNFEEFYKLNCETQDYIIIPVSLQEYQLMPFLSLMCVGTENNQPIYQLIVLRMIDLSFTEMQQNDYAKVIQKYQNKIYQINSICDRRSLSELVIISENNKVIPIYDFQQPRKSYHTTIVYVLYSLPKSSCTIQISFDADQSHKMRKYNPFNVLELIGNNIKFNSRANVSVFSVSELGKNLDYCLALKEQGFTSKRNFYEADDQKRVLNKQPFNFVFNVKFIKKKTWRGIVDPDSTPLENLFEQFNHYFFKVVMNDSTESLPFLISQFSEINYDRSLADNGQSEFFDTLDSYLENYFQEILEIEHLHSISCALGLVDIKFCKKTKFESLKIIVLSLPDDFFAMIIEWKKRSTYKESINGLKNLFILCQKYEFFIIYEIILKILDYNLLFEFLVEMLQKLEQLQLTLAKPQILLIKQYSCFFHPKNMYIFINALMVCIGDIDELLFLLNTYQFICEEVIRKGFNNFLSKGDLSAIEVYHGIYQISELPNFLQLNLDRICINKFIMRNLISYQNIKAENLNVYNNIINLILLKKHLSIEFDHSIIERIVERLGFVAPYKLIKKFPKEVVARLYSEWLTRISKNILDDIRAIDNELINIPEIDQGLLRITANFLLKKYNANELLVTIDKSKLLPLKIELKTAFIEAATNETFEEKFKLVAYLFNINKGNCFLKDLDEALSHFVAPSHEELMTHIVIRPNSKHFLIKIIKENRNPINTFACSILSEFVNTFILDLENSSVKLKTLQAIHKHSESESKLFKECIKKVLEAQNSTTFNKFETFLKSSLDNLKKLNLSIAFISKIFTHFNEVSCGLISHKEEFNIFKSNYLEMQLSKAVLPQVFNPLQVLVSKIYINAVDSKIFRGECFSYIKEKNHTTLNDFSNTCIEVQEKLVIKMQNIISNIEQIRIADLDFITKVITSHELNDEIHAIANFTKIELHRLKDLNDILLRFYSDSEYLCIWEVFKFKDLLQIKDSSSLNTLECWVETRESLTIKDYLIKSNHNFESYIKKDSECLRLLKSLFTSISESQSLIKF